MVTEKGAGSLGLLDGGWLAGWGTGTKTERCGGWVIGHAVHYKRGAARCRQGRGHTSHGFLLISSEPVAAGLGYLAWA